MKKQLLIAAVAATMGTAVIADVSITGNAKYEYFNTQMTSGADTNTANTEVNLLVAGKTGDTSVVANFELNSHGAGSSDTMDIEDLYMKTKVGDVAVKGGNWALGTTALLGEIDEGGRSSNKVDLSTTIAGVKVYAGSILLQVLVLLKLLQLCMLVLLLMFLVGLYKLRSLMQTTMLTVSLVKSKVLVFVLKTKSKSC